MQTIRLKIYTAVDMANYINSIAEKVSGDEVPYIELTSGDASGEPDGYEWVEIKAPLAVTIGDT